MGFSHGYGDGPEKKESIHLIRQAYESGCTFFDTAEVYGNGSNEKLVGEALEPIRDKVVLATKFKIDDNTSTSSEKSVSQFIHAHVDASLKKLGTEYIDLYYQHRVNKNIPPEVIASVMGELIEEGKIRGWGQSQATEEEIRRAHSITPLTAVQSEYSIMERKFEKDVIPACEELGIGFVPFSPLASGFLSGTIQKETEFKGDDVRRVITRFDKNNIEANQPLLDLITSFAHSKGATPAQISLAWMMHKKDFIVPIPGSRTLERIRENLGAAEVEMINNEFQQMEKELQNVQIYGDRTDEDIAKLKEIN